jgi:hypothetical protein
MPLADNINRHAIKQGTLYLFMDANLKEELHFIWNKDINVKIENEA